MLARVPRIDYGTSVLALTIPQDPWTPHNPTQGVNRWSAARIPASATVGQDHDLDMFIRFHEHEYPDVLDFLWFAQTCQPFDVYPDRHREPSVFETCVLVEPHAGTDIVPERVPGFASAFQLAVVVRKQTAGAWDWRFIGDLADS
jgi:hypothetical protein